MVDDPQKSIIKITDIEVNKEKGFVPHINVHYLYISVCSLG